MIVIHDENNQAVTAKIRYRTRTKSFEAVPARIAQRPCRYGQRNFINYRCPMTLNAGSAGIYSEPNHRIYRVKFRYHKFGLPQWLRFENTSIPTREP